MKLNLNTAINKLSYGYVGISIVRELAKLDLDFALIPIGNCDVDNEADAELLSKIINPTLNHFGGGQAYNFHNRATLLKIWHQHDLQNGPVGSPRIGFPIFELNKFSELEKKSLSSCDYLFVCSEWAKKIIVAELGGDWSYRTFVVPLGTNKDVFFPVEQKRNEKFTILNMGKMEVRKGLDIIPAIINKAFKLDDNIELLMSVDNVFLKPAESKEWHDFYLNTPLGKVGKIKFVPRVKTQTEVASLFNSVDVGLFPTRAEGWGLPILDLLACNKPVITTNYSGPSEYLQNDYLIEVEELESAYDGKWFFGEGFWAKLGDKEINQAANHLRGLYDKWSSGESIVYEKGQSIANNYTWAKTAQKIKELIYNTIPVMELE